MYIAYKLFLTYLFAPLIDLFVYDKKGEKNLLIVFLPLCWWLTKRGRKILVYMHVLWKRIYVYAYMFCFANRRKRIWCVLYLSACFISIHLHTCLWALLYIYLFMCYAWVKGELLWSFTIHAYITSWVLSSSKRGRLLTRRPITLVLMMINSCSYSTNDLVFN